MRTKVGGDKGSGLVMGAESTLAQENGSQSVTVIFCSSREGLSTRRSTWRGGDSLGQNHLDQAPLWCCPTVLDTDSEDDSGNMLGKPTVQMGERQGSERAASLHVTRA